MSGLHIDNTVVVSVINKGTAKGATGPRMMEYVREFFGYLLAIIFGSLAHIFPPNNNSLADALSRDEYPDFQSFSTIGNLAATSTPLIIFAFPCSGPPDPPLPALMDKMHEYMVNWLAASSQRTYGAYVRYYLNFCSTYNFRPMQPDETNCLLICHQTS